uniref:Uncharacterized protein n=1 Tax=Arundo donax TaxID=35708 RepID=A0A0A9A4Q7_ARUDO
MRSRIDGENTLTSLMVKMRTQPFS